MGGPHDAEFFRAFKENLVFAISQIQGGKDPIDVSESLSSHDGSERSKNA